MANRSRKSGNGGRFYFLGLQSHMQTHDCSHTTKRCLLLGRKARANLDSTLKKRYYFADKSPYSQSYGFSSNHVQMRELDHKEGWGLKNWCFHTVVLEKILESPLDRKKTETVNPKGNQFWIFIRRTYAQAKAPILWLPDVKNWLIEKDPDAGKDWEQEEKRVTEDDIVGCHHQLNEHVSEQTPGDSEQQGIPVCKSSWGQKVLDVT